AAHEKHPRRLLPDPRDRPRGSARRKPRSRDHLGGTLYDPATFSIPTCRIPTYRSQEGPTNEAVERWVEPDVLLTRGAHGPRAVSWRRSGAGQEGRGLRPEKLRRALHQDRQRMVPLEAGNPGRLRR